MDWAETGDLEETEAFQETEDLEEMDSDLEETDLDLEEAGEAGTDLVRRKIASVEIVNKTTRMSTSTADLEEEDSVQEEVEIVSIPGKTASVVIVSRTTKTSTLTIRCLENEKLLKRRVYSCFKWFIKLLTKFIMKYKYIL